MASERQAATASPSVAYPPEVPSTTTPTKAAEEEIEYPSFRKVLIIMLGIFAAVFLIALDRTIIGTAIPRITDEFDSIGDIGWYASAYLLTLCGWQPTMGRIYTFVNIKPVLLANIVVFEIGSAICGAAPSSTVFIIGRAIAGIGSAGMFAGMIPIFMYILPLEKRPAWTGMFGMVFGVASVVAPLLGGVFTDKVSWRWCFYINLPIGAVVIVILTFMLRLPSEKKEKLTFAQQLDRLDPIGTAIFFPCIICLLLALQWGGITYAWSNARIIALFVLFAVLLIAFIGVQIWRKDSALIPPRIFTNRNVVGGMFVTFMAGSAMMIFVYYTPVWFQAIKNASAVKSGIMNLPLILGLVIASMTAGFLTKKIGYYLPWLCVCAVLMPIGAGLISTWTPTTNHSKWIGYQFLFGFGLGLGMQQPQVAMQTVLSRRDVPIGISLVFLCQSLGGAISTSVSNTVFTNKLASGLATIPGVDVGRVSHVGATNLRNFVPEAALPAVLTVYNAALVDAFYVGVATCACIVIGVLPMEWRSVKASANSSPKPKDVETGATAVEQKQP